MAHEKEIEQLMTFLENASTPVKQEELETFLRKNPECRQAWEEIKELWQAMDLHIVPEPLAGHRERFLEKLTAFETTAEVPEREKNTKTPLPVSLWLWQNRVFRAATWTLLFISGLGLGYWMNNGNSSDQQLDSLQSEVHQMREMLMLNMLKQPSAVDRLKAVSLSTQLSHADTTVISALLQTVNHDPNTNVRLVAIEALLQFIDHPEVRSGLIRAIPNQDSPLVQLALAESMVAMKEKQSIHAFKELLESKSIDTEVREQLEESLDVLRY